MTEHHVRARQEVPPLSLYLHLPFCQTRCSYCDFNTYAGLEHMIPGYCRALAREIRIVGNLLPRPGVAATPSPSGPSSASAMGQPVGSRVHTAFFGGGTPSLTPLPDLALIFDALREAFDFTPDCEISLEANPGTVDRAYLDGLRALGVNRLSFGVQSAHASELKLFERLHTFGQAVEAVQWARAAGFRNLNLDLIFGIPYQTLAMWQETLTRALDLGPDHLACYALSLEYGTPLRSWVYRGLLPMPDPDLAAEMYEWVGEALEASGFVQYEISNWAKSETSEARSRSPETTATARRLTNSDLHYACRHNLQYWQNLPYLGLGAGAHGCIPYGTLLPASPSGWRYSDVLAPPAYIARLENGAPAAFPFSPALAQAIPVTPDETMGETMMLGLRLTLDGVHQADFSRRFGLGMAEKFPRELKRLAALGLIERDVDGVRLTRRARLLGNRVFREFV